MGGTEEVVEGRELITIPRFHIRCLAKSVFRTRPGLSSGRRKLPPLSGLTARTGSIRHLVRRPASLTRRLNLIAKSTLNRCSPHPVTTQHAVVAETLQGVRRSLGTAQPGKTSLLTADLIQVLAHLPAGLAGVRDRDCCWSAIPGATPLRARSLHNDDLAWVPEGAVLTLRRSKTDQGTIWQVPQSIA